MLTPGQKQAARAVGLVVGLGLLAGAVLFALQRVSELPRLATVSPLMLGGIAAAIFFNLALTTTIFWVITLSFDAKPRVSWRTMAALINASALLNYLPLQAGSIGRAAYLKVRNNLPVRQSVVIQFIVMAITVVVPLAVTLVVQMTPDGRAGMRAAAALVVAAAVMLVSPLLAKAMLRRRVVAAWSWAPLRLADLTATSIRLWLAFEIVGSPVTFMQAMSIAAAVMVVNLISITPNGLGFREWAAAGVSQALAAASAPAGVLATLVDRAVEAAVFVVVGLVSIAWLKKDRSEEVGER